MRVHVVGVAILVGAMALAGRAEAQPGGGGKTAAWTAVGAGAGFGVGLWAGLTAFDDAINSDRKVWTSAVLGAAAGATLAYLVSRSRGAAASPSQGPGRRRDGATRVRASAPLDEREIARLVAGGLRSAGPPPCRQDLPAHLIRRSS